MVLARRLGGVGLGTGVNRIANGTRSPVSGQSNQADYGCHGGNHRACNHMELCSLADI